MYTDETAISYKGLSEAELLVALYHATSALGMGVLHDRRHFSTSDAESFLARYEPHETQIRLDYVAGRPFKLTIDRAEKRVGSTKLFDRDAGRGAAARAIGAALDAKRASDDTLRMRR
jgi:hypothetical protein